MDAATPIAHRLRHLETLKCCHMSSGDRPPLLPPRAPRFGRIIVLAAVAGFLLGSGSSWVNNPDAIRLATSVEVVQALIVGFAGAVVSAIIAAAIAALLDPTSRR